MSGAAILNSGSGTIECAPFGVLPGGRTVEIYTLRNRNGMEARIMTFGGVIVSLKTADKAGTFADVVLGHDSLAGYLKDTSYFGALIGRCGNRIANGRFTLGGHHYQLETNNGPNHLHGGSKGFDQVVWQAKPHISVDGLALQLNYESKDGEEGYPGNLKVRAIYTLTPDNALMLEFTATTDKPTLCNLTQHSYFNLRGGGDILGHALTLKASRFTPVTEKLIPTGELKAVEGTPFDFRQSTAIGARINHADPQLKFAGGYDHNWVMDKPADTLGLCARVVEPLHGRVLEVHSTQPGLQFYSGNFLNETVMGKGGVYYKHRTGFCLEPQHFPDSINHPSFPSVVLSPLETYRSTIVYRFTTS